MDSKSNATYVFPRDHLDNTRINLQHFLWVAQFGYITHPKVPVGDGSARIADVGTGTGIWLMDLGSKLPSSTRLDGLDISPDALPPREWLPPNVTFRQWDVKENVPEDLVEQYDLVHIRNFVFVLRDEDVPRVLANLLKLLKPGGYLQWGEADTATYRISKTRPENKIDELNQLIKVTMGSDSRLAPTWVAELGLLFEAAGLDEVESDIREAPAPYLNYAVHECNLIIPELVMRATQNQELARQLGDIMPQALEQTKLGAAWTFARRTVVGRKRHAR